MVPRYIPLWMGNSASDLASREAGAKLSGYNLKQNKTTMANDTAKKRQHHAPDYKPFILRLPFLATLFLILCALTGSWNIYSACYRIRMRRMPGRFLMIRYTFLFETGNGTNNNDKFMASTPPTPTMESPESLPSDRGSNSSDSKATTTWMISPREQNRRHT